MWYYESSIYQIYPLGFCGAPKENDGQQVSRIRKMLDWSDYIKEAGFQAVLFNPLFDSDRHGYDTRDFQKVDCRLGSNQDFKDVCEDLHSHGIKVLLDGVFNHVGRGFWAFRDVLEKREGSAYKDWFYIRFGEDNGYHDGLSYEGWEGHYELVKLNLNNPAVTDYLLASVKLWIEEFGIDGLRLDVAYSLDRGFLEQLRAFCDGLKEDFALIGEIIHGDYTQIVSDRRLHSCTNYECYKGMYSSFNEKNFFEISYSLNRQFGAESWTLYKGMHLMNFVDNHDVSRIGSQLKNEKWLPLIYGLMFTIPGVPCVYYGSEWGIKGDKKDGDDELRPALEAPVKNPLSAFVRKLCDIHKDSQALCYGSYKNVQVRNEQLIFEREYQGERVAVGINLSDTACTINPGLGAKGKDLLTGAVMDLGSDIELAPYQIYIWEL